MRAFVAIDRFVLARFEFVAHQIQKTFGVRPSQLSRLCYAGCIANIVFDFVGHKHFIWIWSLVLACYLLNFFVSIPNQSKKIQDLAIRGLANPEKINPVSIFFRLFWGVFTILVHTPFCLLFMCYAYFLACDELPPGMSRVRKLINSIAALVRKPVAVGAGA